MPTYSGCAGHTKHFHIQKHSLPTSHIREYPRATATGDDDVLRIAIKQYTPRTPTGKENDDGVTMIGAHANGFPKELYEPLWDDLYEQLADKNIHISSIWIADVAHQGDSFVLNEHLLGNDPSWFDHPRDLFLMVNHFREHMKRPIIGIGHSMGGNHLVNLSLMHPRLFTTLVLIDPVIQRVACPERNLLPAKLSTTRRDRWASREEAEAKFKTSKFYQTWHPRVLEKWIEHGLRDLPTALYPEPQLETTTTKTTGSVLPTVSADPSTTISAPPPPNPAAGGGVTLKTTKHQEVLTFLRPNFPTPEYPNPAQAVNPLTHPDVDFTATLVSPFYRPEPIATFHRLPFLRPSVFYIFGDRSELSAPLLIADKLAQTGTGVGGSGGVVQGRVAEFTFPGVGHLIPMEVVSGTAEKAAEWVLPEMRRWREAAEREKRAWRAVPRGKRSLLSDEYVQTIKSDFVMGPSKL